MVRYIKFLLITLFFSTFRQKIFAQITGDVAEDTSVSWLLVLFVILVLVGFVGVLVLFWKKIKHIDKFRLAKGNDEYLSWSDYFRFSFDPTVNIKDVLDIIIAARKKNIQLTLNDAHSVVHDLEKKEKRFKLIDCLAKLRKNRITVLTGISPVSSDKYVKISKAQLLKHRDANTLDIFLREFAMYEASDGYAEEEEEEENPLKVNKSYLRKLFEEQDLILEELKEFEDKITNNQDYDKNQYERAKADLQKSHELIAAEKGKLFEELERITKVALITLLVKTTDDNFDIEHYTSKIIETKSSGVKLSFDLFDKFYSHGVDIQFIINIKNLGLDINWKALSEHVFDKDEFKEDAWKSLINVIVKLHNAGLYLAKKPSALTEEEKSSLKISQEYLLNLYANKVNVEQFVSAVVKAKNMGLEADLTAVYPEENLTDEEIRARKAESKLKLLRKFNDNVELFVDCLVKSKAENLGLTRACLEKHHFTNGNMKDFVDAMFLAKKEVKDSFEITINDLQNYHFSGGKPLDYVKAINTTSKQPVENRIPVEYLRTHGIKGGSPLKLVTGYNIARGAKLPVHYAFLAGIDLDPRGLNLVDIVKNALNPKTEEVEVITVVKAGYKIQMHVGITMMLILPRFFNGSDETIVKERVKEAVIAEVATYESQHEVLNKKETLLKTVNDAANGELTINQERVINESSYEPHEEILKNLDLIAREVRRKLTEDEEEVRLNHNSKYEIIDITIPSFHILEDIFAEMKYNHAKHEAAIKKELAEAKRIEAEADIEQAFADAIREGKASKNDYYKRNIFKPKAETPPPPPPPTDSHNSGGHGGGH